MQASGVYSDIYARLASEKTLFPSIPEETLRLREMLNDPDCNINAAAKVLKANPGLSAFIMKTAGSVRFLTRNPPKDLESGIKRIGLKGTSQLATTFAVRSMFKAPSPELKKLISNAYHSATRVAVISSFLAQHVRGFQPNKAMLGGLLQDIALPLVLKVLSEREAIFNDPVKRHQAIDELCPLVGILILKKWEFDDELIEVVRSRKQWMRDPHKKPDLADVVLIARFHAMLGTPAFKECPPLNEMPAFHKLQLGELTPENSLQILDEAREELAELSQMLS